MQHNFNNFHEFNENVIAPQSSEQIHRFMLVQDLQNIQNITNNTIPFEQIQRNATLQQNIQNVQTVGGNIMPVEHFQGVIPLGPNLQQIPGINPFVQPLDSIYCAPLLPQNLNRFSNINTQLVPQLGGPQGGTAVPQCLINVLPIPHTFIPSLMTLRPGVFTQNLNNVGNINGNIQWGLSQDFQNFQNGVGIPVNYGSRNFNQNLNNLQNINEENSQFYGGGFCQPVDSMLNQVQNVVIDQYVQMNNPPQKTAGDESVNCGMSSIHNVNQTLSSRYVDGYVVTQKVQNVQNIETSIAHRVIQEPSVNQEVHPAGMLNNEISIQQLRGTPIGQNLYGLQNTAEDVPRRLIDKLDSTHIVYSVQNSSTVPKQITKPPILQFNTQNTNEMLCANVQPSLVIPDVRNTSYVSSEEVESNSSTQHYNPLLSNKTTSEDYNSALVRMTQDRIAQLGVTQGIPSNDDCKREMNMTISYPHDLKIEETNYSKHMNKQKHHPYNENALRAYLSVQQEVMNGLRRINEEDTLPTTVNDENVEEESGEKKPEEQLVPYSSSDEENEVPLQNDTNPQCVVKRTRKRRLRNCNQRQRAKRKREKLERRERIRRNNSMNGYDRRNESVGLYGGSRYMGRGSVSNSDRRRFTRSRQGSFNSSRSQSPRYRGHTSRGNRYNTRCCSMDSHEVNLEERSRRRIRSSNRFYSYSRSPDRSRNRCSSRAENRSRYETSFRHESSRANRHSEVSYDSRDSSCSSCNSSCSECRRRSKQSRRSRSGRRFLPRNNDRNNFPSRRNTYSDLTDHSSSSIRHPRSRSRSRSRSFRRRSNSTHDRYMTEFRSSSRSGSKIHHSRRTSNSTKRSISSESFSNDDNSTSHRSKHRKYSNVDSRNRRTTCSERRRRSYSRYSSNSETSSYGSDSTASNYSHKSVDFQRKGQSSGSHRSRSTGTLNNSSDVTRNGNRFSSKNRRSASCTSNCHSHDNDSAIARNLEGAAIHSLEAVNDTPPGSGSHTGLTDSDQVTDDSRFGNASLVESNSIQANDAVSSEQQLDRTGSRDNPNVSNGTESSSDSSLSRSRHRSRSNSRGVRENSGVRSPPAASSESGMNQNSTHNSQNENQTTSSTVSCDNKNDNSDASSHSTRQEPEETTIVCMNLHRGTSVEEIKKLFSTAGSLRDVRMITSSRTQDCKGIAYVEYDRVSSIPAALNLNGSLLRNLPILVSKAPSGRKRDRASNDIIPKHGPIHLFIGMIHAEITEVMLMEIFSSFGHMEEVYISMDQDTGRSRGFGYVTYTYSSNAKRALSTMDRFVLAGTPLRVRYVKNINECSAMRDEPAVRNNTGNVHGATEQLLLLHNIVTGYNIGSMSAHRSLNSTEELSAPTVLDPPTTCLLVRNVFDPKVPVGPHRNTEIQKFIVNMCAEYGSVVHVSVHKHSRDGIVYAQCNNVFSAVYLVKKLHGRYYRGRLLRAEYVPSANYFRRFPRTQKLKTASSSNQNRRI